jgi:hypothetical protein
MKRFLAVVPPVPALLPEYAGLTDPVPELRNACRAAVAWLTSGGPSRIAVLADPAEPTNVARCVSESLAMRTAHVMLGEAGFTGEALQIPPSALRSEGHVLVLANGSARRSEKAPGHLDGRSFAFDDAIENALRHGDAGSLASVDVELGCALMAAGVLAVRSLGSLAGSRIVPTMLYADDPFGVCYWVATWKCES